MLITKRNKAIFMCSMHRMFTFTISFSKATKKIQLKLLVVNTFLIIFVVWVYEKMEKIKSSRIIIKIEKV